MLHIKQKHHRGLVCQTIMQFLFLYLIVDEIEVVVFLIICFASVFGVVHNLRFGKLIATWNHCRDLQCSMSKFAGSCRLWALCFQDDCWLFEPSLHLQLNLLPIDLEFFISRHHEEWRWVQPFWFGFQAFLFLMSAIFLHIVHQFEYIQVIRLLILFILSQVRHQSWSHHVWAWIFKLEFVQFRQIDLQVLSESCPKDLEVILDELSFLLTRQTNKSRVRSIRVVYSGTRIRGPRKDPFELGKVRGE